MSQDVRIVRKDDGLFDLNVSNSAFETVDGFETAIIVSLFTDARAPSSVVKTPSRRRGWIGNILTANSGLELGSRLWTFEQARLTEPTLNDIAVAAQESLSWMVQRNQAKSVSATAEKTGLRDVTVNVSITTIQGKEERYSVLWRRTGDL